MALDIGCYCVRREDWECNTYSWDSCGTQSGPLIFSERFSSCVYIFSAISNNVARVIHIIRANCNNVQYPGSIKVNNDDLTVSKAR